MTNAVWMLSPNFGDALTPWLIKKLTGTAPIYTKAGANYNHHIVSGSMLNHANEHSTVWGAGIANWSDGVNPKAKLRAVRGPLSRMRAITCGAECPEVLGDPALILPKLYSSKSKVEHELGMIPHYVDQWRVNEWYRDKFHIINITDPIETVIDEVAKCKKIISSSLHGLIVAHAYGIPAVWAKFGDSIEGDDTKYRDYFLSVGIDPYPFYDLRQGGLCPVNQEPPKINTDALWRACPFK